MGQNNFRSMKRCCFISWKGDDDKDGKQGRSLGEGWGGSCFKLQYLEHIYLEDSLYEQY